jgi:hypothetical protein
MFNLLFTDEAKRIYEELQKAKGLAKRFKAVRKTLGFLQNNPRHPGLNTHKYISHQGPGGEDIFEAYAENNTPGAYRVFWYYGPGKNTITIATIIPHP